MEQTQKHALPKCDQCGNEAIGWFRGTREVPPFTLDEFYKGVRRFEPDAHKFYFCMTHSPKS